MRKGSNRQVEEGGQWEFFLGGGGCAGGGVNCLTEVGKKTRSEENSVVQKIVLKKTRGLI